MLKNWGSYERHHVQLELCIREIEIHLKDKSMDGTLQGD